MTNSARTAACLAGMVIALLVALVAGGASASAVSSCPYANAAPSEATEGQLRAAVFCLINEQRTMAAVPTLADNAILDGVAQKHTRVMLREDCLRHRCPGERGTQRRLKDAGYLRGTSWAWSEDIGYDNTPQQMLNRWMADSSSRADILSRHFDDLGVGAGKGAPVAGVDDSRFETFTVDFGRP